MTYYVTTTIYLVRYPPFSFPDKDYDVIIQEPDLIEPGPECQEELLLTTNISGATLVVKEAEVKITASNELASGTNVVYSAPTIRLTNGFWACRQAKCSNLKHIRVRSILRLLHKIRNERKMIALLDFTL